MTDWRLSENVLESFHRFYSFNLRYKTHPGLVYMMLPGIAEALDLDEEQRAWLVWLNGNTQNAVTSLLLLEAAPHPRDWRRAVDLWNDNFKLLEWDTDRRHQKNRFGEATEKWYTDFWVTGSSWETNAELGGWPAVWQYAFSQPHMGRLSAWSMVEYARILLPGIPDSDTWLLEDKSGSRSHRNGLGILAGYDSTYWDADAADALGIVDELRMVGDRVLDEADARNAILNYEESQTEGVAIYDHHPDVGRLTMESALCTFKSWRKPNRRYPNVYSDMFYQRIKKAEARFGRHLGLFWDIRRANLPERLRLEDMPGDPGLCAAKQNWFRETGEVHTMFIDYPDMRCEFDDRVDASYYGTRKDPTWT